MSQRDRRGRERATTARLLLVGLALVFAATASTGLVDSEAERGYGNYQDQVILASGHVIFDEILNERVTRLGNRIVAASGDTDVTYTFRIVNSPVINAFATSAGFVYVNTGLLNVVGSEDELAGVIAHEVEHITGSHLIKRIRGKKRKRIGIKSAGIALGVALGFYAADAVSNPAPYTGPSVSPEQVFDLSFDLGYALGDAVAEISIRGYAKKQEIEADRRALEHMRKAGFDPNGLPRFFKRLQRMSDNLEIDIEFASALINAQPGLEARIALLEAQLAEER